MMSDALVSVENDRLSIKQVFNAPIARVFACLTQVELLNQWHAPSSTMTTEAVVDFRVGGAYSISMTNTDGETHTATGRYREIDEPTRLVYTWAWEGREGPETVVTISLKDLGEQTEVELIHEGFTDADVTQHHSQGWNGIFAQLDLFTA